MTGGGKGGVAAIVWCGVLAALIVTVVFAPVMRGGWCADAPTSGASMCVSFERSLLGADTTWWLWAIALAIVVTATFLIARRRARSSHG